MHCKGKITTIRIYFPKTTNANNNITTIFKMLIIIFLLEIIKCADSH